MVLTEVAVMTVVGVLTYRSLHRVGKAVKAIHVPRSSLLAGRKHLYSDAYMIALPKEFQLVQGTGSRHAVTLPRFGAAFFTCPVFANCEKQVLKLAYRCPEPDFGDGLTKFRVGEKVYIWEVAEKSDDEMLLKWKFRSKVEGTTWFCISDEDNCLAFGSSIHFPSKRYRGNVSTESLLKGSSKRLRRGEETFPSRLRKAVEDVLLAMSLAFHQTYSKYLLFSTWKKLTQSPQTRKTRR